MKKLNMDIGWSFSLNDEKAITVNLPHDFSINNHWKKFKDMLIRHPRYIIGTETLPWEAFDRSYLYLTGA